MSWFMFQTVISHRLNLRVDQGAGPVEWRVSAQLDLFSETLTYF